MPFVFWVPFLKFSRNSGKCCVEELGQGVLLWSGVVVVILMRVHSTHERESGAELFSVTAPQALRQKIVIITAIS
jgi:hypothetical protein